MSGREFWEGGAPCLAAQPCPAHNQSSSHRINNSYTQNGESFLLLRIMTNFSYVFGNQMCFLVSEVSASSSCHFKKNLAGPSKHFSWLISVHFSKGASFRIFKFSELITLFQIETLFQLKMVFHYIFSL
jgi:hypothetical protein